MHADSQLVAYLQSELALRNARIASLELQERDLNRSVEAARSDLQSLKNEKVQLEKQVTDLNQETQSARQMLGELRAHLSESEFFLVREKIATKLASGLTALAVLRIHLSTDWEEPGGVKAQDVSPWDFTLKHIQASASKLPESDRVIADNVIVQFIQQCERLRSIVIKVPNIPQPAESEYAQYGYDRSKHPTSAKVDALNKRIERAEADIHRCFQMVTPER